MTWNALNGFASWSIDYEAGDLEVVMTDGRAERRRTRASVTDFKRVCFRVQDLTLEMVTPTDEAFVVEVFAHDDQVERRSGRPVIYLDQNKWIQLAQSIHRPERVPKHELEPARRLADLARAGEIILPISSAHWVETSPTYGDRRRRLASLMVSLSRGWIMRDPLRVRASELAAMFSSFHGAGSGLDEQPPVFTLDAREVRAEPWNAYTPTGGPLPPEIVEVIDVLLGAQAVLAVLLENERTPRERALAARWANYHETFAEYLAREPTNRRRTLTLLRFLADLGTDQAKLAVAAGLTPVDYGEWLLERADDDVASLPYLGRFREVIHLKLRDPRRKWEANDLFDLMYLPCAAGYADSVVCEIDLAHHLELCGQARDGAAIFTSIAELTEHLETSQVGKTTPAHRSAVTLSPAGSTSTITDDHPAASGEGHPRSQASLRNVARSYTLATPAATIGSVERRSAAIPPPGTKRRLLERRSLPSDDQGTTAGSPRVTAEGENGERAQQAHRPAIFPSDTLLPYD